MAFGQNQTRHQNSEFKDIIQQQFGEYSVYVGHGRSNFYDGERQDMNLAFGRGSADVLKGGRMSDDLMGGAGRDLLIGGDGADHLDGGRGADVLFGGKMMDNLRGGEGNDFLDEGDGHGDLEGGKGNDTLVGGRGADAFVIAPDSGHDIILDFRPGPGMFDHLAVNGLKPEDLRFQDTAKGVLISWDSNQGSVLLVGVDKKDLAQDDFMFADDRYLIQPTSASSDRVNATSFAKNEGGALHAPAASGNSMVQTLGFDDFHIQRGRETADVMQGTPQRDVFLGLAGNDRLFGGGNDDHLAGDAGNDVIDGGDGMDDLKGGMGADQVFGGAMADNLMGEGGDDFLYGGAGHDMLEGGTGNDVLNGGDGADAFIVMFDSGNDTVTGGFDAGPGAFDHIAFVDILPNQVKVTDTNAGALVSWQTSMGSGSLLLKGVAVTQLSQDDFMFSDIEGGAFVNAPAISSDGADYIFF